MSEPAITQKLLIWLGVLALSIGWILPSGARATVIVTPQEMAQRTQWVRANLLSAEPPFSFIYNQQASANLLPFSNRAQADMPLSLGREEHVRTWTHGQLQVKCVAVEYRDYPMV